MEARAPGRPRSEEARRAVLDATRRLIQTRGYGAVTMEGIAREAGVSKQTVYRWWPRKADVVLEGLNERAETIAPAPDSGVFDDDLRTLLRTTVAAATPENRRFLAALMAEAQIDESFGRSFRGGFLARRRQVLLGILERGQESRQIAESADLGLLVDIAFGTLWYRILSAHAPLDHAFADGITDAILRLAKE